MGSSIGQLTVADVLRRFAGCASCVGYCRDSGRQEMADDIQDDVVKVVALLQAVDSRWIDSLLDMANAHSDPWVKYFALISVGKFDAVRSLGGLETVFADDLGLVSANAGMALFQLRKN